MKSISKIWQDKQCNATIPDTHGKVAPLLGESTSPQGVNGLILPYPYLIYLRGMHGVSHGQIVQSN
jgi:hypothetical protein